MSQAEQVPEDMPAYLKDEPVGAGKPLTSTPNLFPLYRQPLQVAVLDCEPWKLGETWTKLRLS